MIRVLTNTGADLVVGEHTFSPTKALTVEAMTPEMEFYKTLLRFEHVDENGNPVEEPEPEGTPAPVPASDHEAVVQERDDLRAKNADLEKRLTASSESLGTASSSIKDLGGQIETLTSSKREVEASLATVTKERDGLRADLGKAISPEDHKAVVDELTEATKQVEKLQADLAKAPDPKALTDLTKERDGLSKQVEKLTADLAKATAKPSPGG